MTNNNQNDDINTPPSPQQLQRQTEMLWELLSCSSTDIIGELITMYGDLEVKANFPEEYAEFAKEQQESEVDK